MRFIKTIGLAFISFSCSRAPSPTVLSAEGIIHFESRVENSVKLKLPAKDFKPLVAIFSAFSNGNVKIQEIMGQEIIGGFKFGAMELEWGGDDFWIYNRNKRVWQFYDMKPDLNHLSVHEFLRKNKKINESDWLEILERWAQRE